MESAAGADWSFSQQCSSCDASSARCWCVDCNEALCDACVSAHRRVSVTRSHEILNQPAAGSVSTSPIKFCRLHPAEPLKLFCYTCNQLTCRDCQLMGHMNHRYQFVREALDSLKKELEVLVQPIRAKRDTARRSLQDMETRLQDIAGVESNLKTDLQNSYNIICEQLKKRMYVLMNTAKTVCTKEAEDIQRKIQELKQLQQNQEWLTETSDKAQNTNDLVALFRYKAQVESELKKLDDQNSSPPSLMPKLIITTNKSFLQIILNFGELDVSWVPFSVDRDTTTASCGLRPQTSATVNTISPGPPGPPGPLNSSSSSPLCLPSSTLSLNLSSAPLTVPTTVTCTPAVKHLSSSPVVTSSLPGSNLRQVLPKTPAQSVCTSVNLQPVSFCLPPQPPNITFLDFLNRPLVLSQPAAPQQAPPPVLLTSSQQVFQVLPVMLSKAPSFTAGQKRTGSGKVLPVAAAASNITPPTSCKPLPQTRTTNDLSSSSQLCLPPPCSSAVTLPTSTCRPLPSPVPENHLMTPQPASDPTPPRQTATYSDLQPLRDQIVAPSGPLSLLQCLTSGSPGSSSQSPVVRAVADSACDLSVQQVTARQPVENEPTSTMYEETEPAAKPAELSDAEEDTHGSLSQSQPPPRPGRRGEEEELQLETREDSQSRVDDITDDVTEPRSSPESPVTLQIVSCSACGSAYGSIICSACGRGFHRDCHVPPVGPDLRSVWLCSLCQDLSDPSDPYSSDRPQGPPSPGLSLLDQRKCESLLLCVKVEGGGRLSEPGSVRSDLELISKRLTRHASYQTAAEFLCDVRRLFADMKDDDGSKKLRETFQSRLQQTWSPELHLPVLPPASSGASGASGSEVGSEVRSEVGSEVRSEVRSEIGSEVRSEVGSEVRSEVRSEVGSEVRSEVGSEVRSEVGSEVRSEVGSEVRSEVRSEVGSEVRSEVGSAVRSEVRSEVGSEVRSEVGSEVRSEVRSEVGSQQRVVTTRESKLTEIKKRLRELLPVRRPDQRGQKRRTDLVLPQDHLSKRLRCVESSAPVDPIDLSLMNSGTRGTRRVGGQLSRTHAACQAPVE